jgi:hypothetical protein
MSEARKCIKEFCHEQAVEGRLNCTAHGKSAEKYESHSVMQSGRRMGKSTAVAAFAQSHTSSNKEQTQLDEKKTENESGPSITPIPSQPGPLPSSELSKERSSNVKDIPKHGWNEAELIAKRKEELAESGIVETLSESGPKSTSGDGGKTLVPGSTGLSIRLGVEILDSVDLLNKSSNHLYRLMKSYAKVPGKEESVHLTVQQMSVVANLAKNVNALIRTKLDIAKELRKS